MGAYRDEKFYVWGNSGNSAVLFQTDTLGRLGFYKAYSMYQGRLEGFSMRVVDTSVYLLGTADVFASGGGMKMFIVKARLDGSIVWQRFFDSYAYHTHPYSLDMAPNGDIFFVTSHAWTQAVVYCLSPEGDMRWQRPLADAVSQFFCVRPIGRDAVVVSGMADDYAYIAKLDRDGDPIWQLKFGQGNLHVAKSFVELPNGDFFINGYVNYGSRDVVLARVSAVGELQWVKYLDRQGLEDVNYGSSLDTDGNVLLTGYTFYSPTTYIDYVMAKCTPDGVLVWTKALNGANDDHVDNGPDHLMALGNGTYVAMGSSSSSAGGRNGADFVLMRFTAATDTGCFNSNYVLRPSSFSGALPNHPAYAYNSGAVPPSLPLRMTVTDGQPCRRHICIDEQATMDPIGADLHGCRADTVELDAGNFGSTYRWSTGAVTRTLYVTQPGAYWVDITGGCANGRQQIVVASIPSQVPVAEAGPRRRICEGTSVNLGSEAVEGQIYRWTPATDLDRPTQASPVVTGRIPASVTADSVRMRYTVRVTVPGQTCAATDTVSVIVYRAGAEATGCTFEPLLIPNVVTPGSGTENATFLIKRLRLYNENTLDIYDRWGVQVYQASPYHNDWHAEGLPPGLYFYRLRAPSPGWDFKGWVEVVK